MNFLSFDEHLFFLVHEWGRGAVLDMVLPLLSLSWFLPLVLGAVLFVACWFRRALVPRVLEMLLLVALCLPITDGSCLLVKNAVGRLRPYQALGNVHYVEYGKWTKSPVQRDTYRTVGSSFLSAHAANSMALVWVLMRCFPASRWWMLCVPLLVGWSRLYLGRHYPLDVVSGWLLGWGIAVLVCGFWFRFRGCLPVCFHFWEASSRGREIIL